MYYGASMFLMYFLCLAKKQALFRRDLEQLVRKKINIEDIVEEFIAGLANHVDDIKQFVFK